MIRFLLSMCRVRCWVGMWLGRVCSCMYRYLCRFCVVRLIGLLCRMYWWIVLIFLVFML